MVSGDLAYEIPLAADSGEGTAHKYDRVPKPALWGVLGREKWN
jgi:hypothetical protein